MEDRPIRRVMVHGEKAAAYMADGYARASGKPGVCMAQMIGASNLAAGLRDGFMAGAPMIAITGGPTPQSRYRHAYQEVDDISQFDAVTKFNAQIDHVAPHARSHPPGVPGRDLRRARPGAPAGAESSRPDHRGGGRPRSAGGRSLSARAGVPSRARHAACGERARGAEHGGATDDRRRRRRDPLRRAGGGGGACGEAVDPGRDLAQRQGRDRRRPSAGGRASPAPIRATAPTARSRRPTSCSSSAVTPAGR